MSWRAAIVFEDDSEIEIPHEYDSQNEAFQEGADYGDEFYGQSDCIHVWNTENEDEDYRFNRRG